ncbi:MAG: hypothetical protein P4L40_14060 [Terracidiphilus sp.]|nr:hypothetical protein [Terracidiphilus sp.]
MSVCPDPLPLDFEGGLTIDVRTASPGGFGTVLQYAGGSPVPKATSRKVLHG